MSFTSAITETVPGGHGSHGLVYGTYTNTAGSTGGDIATGLQNVQSLWLQPKGSAVATNASVINEVFPLFGDGKVTIVTDADQVGYWVAIGY